ncbi:MAG: ATP-binding protein, partial [Bacteroidales bacterium]|nr:ATP-binding protein [Bacteroidales bacterium]
YAVDVAMMNQRKDAFSGDNLGWRLETIVLAQLLRKCKVEGWDLYYMLERSGECDFIVCKGDNVLQAVQVSYDISAPKTRRREINGALMAAKATGCKNLLLLTDHNYEEIEQAGFHIKVQPVYDWSLSMG